MLSRCFDTLPHKNVPGLKPSLRPCLSSRRRLLWRDAARIGQTCRDLGFTAGSLDLVIAAVAIHYDAELVTFDTDYEAISRACALRVTCLTRE